MYSAHVSVVVLGSAAVTKEGCEGWWSGRSLRLSPSSNDEKRLNLTF